MKSRPHDSIAPRIFLALVACSFSAASCDDTEPNYAPDADAYWMDGGSSQNDGQGAPGIDAAPDMSVSDAAAPDTTQSDTAKVADAPASSDTLSDAAADVAPPPAFEVKWFAQGVGDVEAITRGPDDTLWFITTGGKIGHLKAENDIPEFQIDAAVILGTTGRNRIVKGPDGNLWFTIDAMRRFGHITPTGTITVATELLPFNPDDITVGPDDNLWVSGYGAGVARITTAESVTIFPCGATNTIRSGPDGNLWFVDINKGLGRITPAGVITQFPLLEPNEESLPQGFAIANGQLWAIGSRVVIITMMMLPPEDLLNLSFTRRLTTTGTFSGPAQVIPAYRGGDTSTVGTATAVGPEGALWYYETKTQIGRVLPDGTVQRFAIPDPGTTYRFSKMTFDAAGALWLPMRGGLLRFTLVP